MPAVSNGAFLPVLPPPPLPSAGWSVRVIAHTDLVAYARGDNPTPLTVIHRFQALSWSPEISGVGAGSITLSLADPLWDYPLSNGRPNTCLRDYENLWVIYEDGQWRGEFLGEKVSTADLPTDEEAGRATTISGPGAAQVLSWARVLSPYYPRTPPKNKIAVYQYRNQPVMASWLHLLGAAQSRGTIGFVRARFSATRDTGGQKWEDTAKTKPAGYDTAHLAGQVMFAPGSAAFTPALQAAAAAIAAKLSSKTSPRVTVTGYTDDRERATSAGRNQLGLDRANAVANAILAARPQAQVSTVSAGKGRPVASNRTAAGRARNRRVRVVYQRNPAFADSLYTPERGTTLLDLLNQLTAGTTTAENRGPIHCEWIMRKGFALQVRSQIGKDRSQRIVYHQASLYLNADTVDADRSGIANVVAVQNDLAVYKVSVGATSRKRWGQREAYTRLEGTYTPAVQARIALTSRQAQADQSTSRTVAVNSGFGRHPFRDFTIGDEIGIVQRHRGQPSTISKQRVMAISVSINADGAASYELTLQSTRVSRIKFLQTQVDALINRKKGIRAYIQDDQPTGGMPGDLWTTR